MQRRFRRLKSDDFDVEDKERFGQPKAFEDEELQALVDEDPSNAKTTCRSIKLCSICYFRLFESLGKGLHGRKMSLI